MKVQASVKESAVAAKLYAAKALFALFVVQNRVINNVKVNLNC